MTRSVGLIGNPLRRRHSEVMHNAAFEHFGIDATYRLLTLEPDQLGQFVARARADSWLGFQVTAPYKQAIVEHLDVVEDGARRIGAVNSVVQVEPGMLIGFNTDAPAFRLAAEDELQIEFAGVHAAVAGAGGVARAVVDALVEAGAGSVAVANRTPERARALAADFGPTVHAVHLGAEFDDALQSADFAVNATTIGMTSRGVPFDVAMLPRRSAVFDVVYQPPETDLLTHARSRGLTATNGLGMLVAQAELAFARWTGVAEAGSVMRSALETGT